MNIYQKSCWKIKYHFHLIAFFKYDSNKHSTFPLDLQSKTKCHLLSAFAFGTESSPFHLKCFYFEFKNAALCKATPPNCTAAHPIIAVKRNDSSPQIVSIYLSAKFKTKVLCNLICCTFHCSSWTSNKQE